MTKPTFLHEDKWGAIIDYPDAGFVEIRWYDTTRDISGDEFNNWLSTFAGCVESQKRAGVLVDSNLFRMDMSKMDNAWRDANIIPRYNAAGVQKFAFHMPAGMPAIGKPPQKEGPGQFPTGYFATRVEALAWLHE